jgi:thioesterase domain-containing protein
LLLEAGWKGSRHLKILCGGEAWGEELARQLLPRCESLWNMYGPTETTIWSAATKVEPGQSPCIGVPISNTQFYVLDSRLQPVPIGVAGELHIGGDGLARGYLHRAELTAEKFVQNPFSPDTASRIYKTGDLVRYRPSGQIEFLGRLDHQVKIRGFRIELGEIQSLLSLHPEIVEALVVAREDVPGDKRLVAYVAANKSSIPVDELRQFLKQKLPEYMVPSAFVFLDRLPKTPNGKVDRKALPAPESSRSATQFVAARDPLELQLTKLWEKIFKIGPIGIRDNFFELGGHSLLAVRLFADIEKITGTNLPLVTLFQAPTIEGLAAILRQQGWEAPWSSLVAIKPGGSKPPFYCVHGVGGNILEYLDLAKYMDEDQPFYGLQAVGLDGKRPWLKTVEEMATHYIKEIQEFQPQGPYYIGGSSFGGLVAFEMAQQLRQRGERIALLAFFDTYAPGYPKLLPPTSMWRYQWERLSFRLSLHWGNFIAARGRDRFLYIWTKIKKWCNGQLALIKKAKRKWQHRREKRLLPKAILGAQQAGHTAHATYKGTTYPSDATLFRATVQIVGTAPHPTLGWSEFIEGRIDVFDTPGHHGSIVRDPRARILAQQLKETLCKAQLKATAETRSSSAVIPDRLRTAGLVNGETESNGQCASTSITG